MTKRLVGLLAVAVLASILTAAPSAQAAPGPALKRAVTVYSNAFLSGQGARAYKMLTPRCKGRIGRADFVDASRLAHRLYGQLPIRKYRATISGRRAQVTYTYAVKRLNQTRESWHRLGSVWKNNDC